MPGHQDDEFLQVERNLFEYAHESGIKGNGAVQEDSRKICFCSSLDIPALNLAYLKVRPEMEDLEEIELFFRERGNPYTIWMPEKGDGPIPNLIELDLNHAMSLPAMVADLDNMLLDLRPPFGCSLRFVDQESDMDAFARAAFNGFELPKDIRHKFTDFIRNLSPSRHPRNELVVALKGEEPVASGLMFRGGDDIGLYWVSVVPSQRSNGLGSWLTQEILRTGRKEGYQHAVLQSSPVASSLYRRLGFRGVGNFQVFSH